MIMIIKVIMIMMIMSRRQITWARGNIMFHSGKKRARHSKVILIIIILSSFCHDHDYQVSVSGKGGLKIKTIGFKDSGIYTCMGRITIIIYTYSTMYNNNNNYDDRDWQLLS